MTRDFKTFAAVRTVNCHHNQMIPSCSECKPLQGPADLLCSVSMKLQPIKADLGSNLLALGFTCLWKINYSKPTTASPVELLLDIVSAVGIGLVRFVCFAICLFVDTKMPNNAVMSQNLIVFIGKIDK